MELIIHCKWRRGARKSKFFGGVLAQLVERLNGIEEVRGSIPLGSKYSQPLDWQNEELGFHRVALPSAHSSG